MERGPTLALSCLFAGPLFFLLGRIATIEESHLYVLWFLVFGFFIAGVLIWGYRCGLSYNKTNRRLIRVLEIFFITISSVIGISVGLVLVLLYSLYVSAFSLFATTVLWEVISEVARRIR